MEYTIPGYDDHDFESNSTRSRFTCRICTSKKARSSMTMSQLKQHCAQKMHIDCATLEAERRQPSEDRSRSSQVHRPEQLSDDSSFALDDLGSFPSPQPAPGQRTVNDLLTDLELDPSADPAHIPFLASLRDSISRAGLLEKPLLQCEEADFLEHDSDFSDTGSEWDGDLDGFDDETLASGPIPVGTAENEDTRSSSTWRPWRSKALFLTNLLFSSPRMRFSRVQMKAILSWARELGADAPTYDAWRRSRDELRDELGDATTRQCSASGTPWYLNAISDSVAKDIANPKTRAQMGPFYPERVNGSIKEVWQASKLLEDIPDDLLTPVARDSRGNLYFIGELLEDVEKRLFIPRRYFLRSQRLWASGNFVSVCADGRLHVEDSGLNDAGKPVRKELPLLSFRRNIDSLLSSYPNGQALFDDGTLAVSHPLRAVARNRMVFSVPVIIFIDDVSGNQSKQWNKHFACYMSNGLLKREALMEEFHVRFVAASPSATPLEIMQGVKSSVQASFENPVEAYDAQEREEVLLRFFPLLHAGDNPMQAELCSCTGLTGNFFCRTCHAGGTQEYKRSDEGFASIFRSDTLRSATDTREKVFQQLAMSLEPDIATALTNAVRDTGIKDGIAQPVIDHIVKLGQNLRKASTPEEIARTPEEVQAILTEELRKAHGQGGVYNPLLDLQGVDIHQDTPTEILHTILLGVVKYYWAQTVVLLEKDKKFGVFQARLNSIATDGLNIPAIPAEYICQYKGALIGKHFKTLSQIMAFTVYDLVPQTVLDAWTAIGRLTVMLWHTEIEDMDSYLGELQVCIDEFMNITALCSPSILLSKPKFHFLVHLPFYIRRFGPAILYSTERFESYNAVFRAASMHSNRMAPSRDIAWAFAGLDRIKHVATGGWWKDKQTGKWIQASENVRKHIQSHPEHAKLLGLRTEEKRTPGDVTFQVGLPGDASSSGDRTHTRVRKERIHVEWEHSKAHKSGLSLAQVLDTAFPGPASQTQTLLSRKHAQSVVFMEGRSVIARSLDVAKPGNTILYDDNNGLKFGRLLEILIAIPAGQSNVVQDLVYLTVEQLALGGTLHEKLKLPMLKVTAERHVLNSRDLICIVNVQHDCYTASCTDLGAVNRQVEREAAASSRRAVMHRGDTDFILNMNSLHNYQHLASAVYTSLPKPTFDLGDVGDLRRRAAASVRARKAQEIEEQSDDIAEKLVEHLSGVDRREDAEGLMLEALGTVLARSDSAENEASDDLGAQSGAADPSRLDPPPSSDIAQPIFEQGAVKVRASRKPKPPTSLQDCTQEILKELCRTHKLHVSGNKSDQLERLQAYFSQNTQAQPTAAQLEIIQKRLQAENIAKKLQRGEKRKRRDGEEDEETEADAGRPQRKRRGAVDDELRLANVQQLRQLIIG